MSLQLDELDPGTRGHVERGKQSLCEEFRGIFSAETIDRYCDESLADLSGARFQDFVPLFVHRFARERLRALAQVEGKLAKEVPEVLFVCVHNAGRSQMAAGLLDQLADGRVHVRTAGSDPADEINPAVVEAMAEVGHRSFEGVPEAAHRRSRQGRRRRDHDGLRRRLPDLPRQALRGLGARGPGRARTWRRCGRSATTSRSRVSALLAELAPDESSD